jgi:hypothetical protein
VNLSAEDVREILRLLDAIDADELQVETERFTLTLRRAAGATTVNWKLPRLVWPSSVLTAVHATR